MDGKPDARLALVERFFSGTGRSYDFMVNAATFGIDRLWKRRIVELLPRDATRIVDLACGTGISTLAIARKFPDARIVGVELRDEYLAIAREKFRKLGMRNVEFVLSRAEEFAPAERFDCVVSSYLAKYADLARLTRNTHAMLEPGGLLLMHDFTYPPEPVLRRVFWLYFSVMRGAGSRFFPSWREIFQGLPELIQATRWLSELERELRSNRFTDLRTEYLTLYGSAIVTARK